MSHFSNIKTQIRNLTSLEAAFVCGWLPQPGDAALCLPYGDSRDREARLSSCRATKKCRWFHPSSCSTLECVMSDSSPIPERSGLEPELGGIFRDAPERSGFEPELGGVLRQKGVYVDEITCIGCKHCAHVARNTFYIEEDYGRSRVVRQDGDAEEVVQEAIDTCPVDCIHWVDYTELKHLEEERQYQVIPIVGYPIDHSLIAIQSRQKKLKQQRKKAKKEHQ